MPKDLDSDLTSTGRGDLILEIKKLRAGIRAHRDSQGHDLCWYAKELWDLLPEKITPEPNVPGPIEFIGNCILYRCSLRKKP